MKSRRFSAISYGLRIVACAGLFAGALFSPALEAAGAQAPSATKRVLVLYWYGKDFPGNVMFQESFLGVLKQQPGTPVEYYPEYLETDRFPGEAQALVLRDYLRGKYAGMKIDAVVTLADPSLNFMLAHRDELFPDAPIIFNVARSPANDTLTAGPGMTGLLTASTHRETLDLALKLHPQTRHVYVVSGSMERDKRWENRAREALQGYDPGVTIEYLTDLPLDELIERTKNFSKDSLVLYAWQQSLDENGRLLESRDTLARISPTITVPIYGMSTANLGNGIIGGYLVGPDRNGEKVAEIVLRILNGKRAQDIPVDRAPFGSQFDWRELRRWGIDDQDLPADAVVLFRQYSFIERYRWEVTAVASLVILEAALIAVLLANRSRRVKAEKENLRLAQVAEHERMRLAEVVSNLPGIVWETKSEGGGDNQQSVFVSDYAETMMGYAPEEIASMPGLGLALIPDADRQEVQGSIQEVLASGKASTIRFKWVTKDGRLLWAESHMAPVFNEKGRPIGLRGVTLDITERIRAEEARRESEQRFRNMADTAPVMIWVSGPDRRCTYFNQVWLDFTGRTLEQELGDGWAEGVHSEDLARCLEAYNSGFDLRQPFKMEYRLRRADGEFRWVYDSGTPRFSSSNEFLGFIGSCMDITERRETEEALMELSGHLITAQEDERRRIARELHDDLNQRMALISIGLERLRQKPPETNAKMRQQLQALMDQTLEISKEIHRMSYDLHPSWLFHVGLVAAIRGLCDELRPRHGLIAEFTHQDMPATLPQDVSLCLYRVVQECLSNVIKHSGAKEARVILDGSEHEIRLRVSDSGRGFDIGSANTHKGLGLISMQERLRLVGGRVSIDSQPSQGTRIDARVPLRETEPSEQGISGNNKRRAVRAE